jgi:hypothetical protein
VFVLVIVLVIVIVRSFLVGDLSPDIFHVDFLDLTYEVFESLTG